MKRILFIIAALCLLLTSCGAKDSADGANETTKAEQTTAVEETTEEIEFYKTDEEVYEIENSLCILKFPVKWKDVVTTTVSDDKNRCSVVFTANLDGMTIGLYTIEIADESEGYCLGTVKTSAGDKNVYLIDQYDEYSEMLSDESKDIYLQLCEDVNALISKLVYDNGMILS